MNKIWGISFSPLGDLVMGLPILTYFEKKYPGSYHYWVIKKKCAFSAPIFLNHPLIDRIKITDNWKSFGEIDNQLMSQCDTVIKEDGWKHSRPDWYNYKSCVEETAFIAGIKDFKETLTEQEMKPKLVKWFDVGSDTLPSTWSKQYTPDLSLYHNSIGIWATATGLKDFPGLRSPTTYWWKEFIDKVGLRVFHFGRPDEPIISENPNYINMTSLSYFDQVKASLATNVVIGPDSGSMWVNGAYSHPAIHLIANWLPSHKDNVLALNPINGNSVVLFAEKAVRNIPVKSLIQVVERFMK